MEPAERLPPIHGDPELIGHPEGNRRWRDIFRRAVIEANRVAAEEAAAQSEADAAVQASSR